MKFNHVLFLGLVLISQLFFSNAYSQRNYKVYNCKDGSQVTLEELAKQLIKNYDVIFFGEFHDDSLIHSIQYELLNAMVKASHKLAISLEMFERDVQPNMNLYLEGKMNEQDFKSKTRPWPDYDIFYKPLIETAKSNKLDVVAANVPRKYAALYSSGGISAINSLPTDQRKYIAKDIHVNDDDYQKVFIDQMLATIGKEPGSFSGLSYNQQNTLVLFYGAQCVKDETMAESIYDYLKSHKKNKVLHFNGDFHSNNYYGTVQKLKDRNHKLKIAVIFPEYAQPGKPVSFNESLKDRGDYQIVLDYKEQEEYTESMMAGHMGMNTIESHKIYVQLDPAKHFLSGTDTLKFKNPVIRKASFSLLKDLQISSITSKAGKVSYEVISDTGNAENQVVISTQSGEISEIVVSYSGKVYNAPETRLLNQRHSNSSGMVSDLPNEGIYLPAGSFYPYTLQDMSNFRVEVSFPENLEVITSGTVEKHTAVNGLKTYIFKTELPADALTLVGGNYQLVKDTMYDGKKFTLYAYNKDLEAKSYLEACIKYYKYYTGLLGPYPYNSFAIVENFFATGFGMPGYTLLSNLLMKMPWVLFSPGSLAHEFVHSWWGNSVYTNHDRENWCEGLTTFCANYYYNELTNKPSKCKEWRQSALVSIANLPDKANYPLKNFKYQVNDDDAVIGYSKAGFLFYELYRQMGKDNFFNALKSFARNYKGKRALWFSLNYMMQQYCKMNGLNIPINRIFNQYLNPTRIPVIRLEKMERRGDSCYFTITQDTAFYNMVPVRVITYKDTVMKEFIVSKLKNEIALPAIPAMISIEVDPDYQVLRKLNIWEIPLTFKQNMNTNPLVILPVNTSPDYKPALDYVNMLNQTGYQLKAVAANKLNEKDLAGRSWLVIGTPQSNPFYQKLSTAYPIEFSIAKETLNLQGKALPLKDQLMMANFEIKNKPGQYCTVIYAENIGSAETLRRFSHYSSYSIVLVAQARGSQAQIQEFLYPTKPMGNPLLYRFPNE